MRAPPVTMNDVETVTHKLENATVNGVCPVVATSDNSPAKRKYIRLKNISEGEIYVDRLSDKAGPGLTQVLVNFMTFNM